MRSPALAPPTAPTCIAPRPSPPLVIQSSRSAGPSVSPRPGLSSQPTCRTAPTTSCPRRLPRPAGATIPSRRATIRVTTTKTMMAPHAVGSAGASSPSRMSCPLRATPSQISFPHASASPSPSARAASPFMSPSSSPPPDRCPGHAETDIPIARCEICKQRKVPTYSALPRLAPRLICAGATHARARMRMLANAASSPR